MGKKIDGKTRLLIVTLENLSSKHNIMRLAHQLRQSTSYINIYITPDLTRKERETKKKLWDELSSNRRAGETVWPNSKNWGEKQS